MLLKEKLFWKHLRVSAITVQQCVNPSQSINKQRQFIIDPLSSCCIFTAQWRSRVRRFYWDRIQHLICNLPSISAGNISWLLLPSISARLVLAEALSYPLCPSGPSKSDLHEDLWSSNCPAPVSHRPRLALSSQRDCFLSSFANHSVSLDWNNVAHHKMS